VLGRPLRGVAGDEPFGFLHGSTLTGRMLFVLIMTPRQRRASWTSTSVPKGDRWPENDFNRIGKSIDDN
jgi:hypothetical protein